MGIKKILIIFPDNHILYSPTILNIINDLENYYFIHLLIPNRKKLNNTSLNNTSIYQYSNNIFEVIEKLMLKIDGFINLFINKRILYSLYKILIIRIYITLNKDIKLTNYHAVICIDNIGFFAGLIKSKKIHYISLEFYKNDLLDIFLKKNMVSIKTLVIQNMERKNIFFKEYNGKVFFIPNSPIYTCIEKNEKCVNTVIYSGSFIEKFGKNKIIQFANKYNEFKIYIIGPNKIEKNNNENIIFKNKYIQNKDLNNYLAKFEIGLALYDFDVMKKEEKEHFFILSSGKVHNYMNARVPVIATRCSGLEFIEVYNSGILLENTDPRDIYLAILKIKKNYNIYQNGCKEAAKKYDFKAYSKKYLRFINESE